jgi:hypothetical protein
MSSWVLHSIAAPVACALLQVHTSNLANSPSFHELLVELIQPWNWNGLDELLWADPGDGGLSPLRLSLSRQSRLCLLDGDVLGVPLLLHASATLLEQTP